jgi:hypothetical protein
LTPDRTDKRRQRILYTYLVCGVLMSVKLHRPAAHRANEAETVVSQTWGPADAEQLQSRLDEIARSRPGAVAQFLEHWLNTPHGESHFDVKS